MKSSHGSGCGSRTEYALLPKKFPTKPLSMVFSRGFLPYGVALRLTGRRWQTIAADGPLANLVSEKMKDFVRGLSDKDLAILKSELERIVLRGDTAARDAPPLLLMAHSEA